MNKEKKNSKNAVSKDDTFSEFSSEVGNTKITQTKDSIHIQANQISIIWTHAE